MLFLVNYTVADINLFPALLNSSVNAHCDLEIFLNVVISICQCFGKIQWYVILNIHNTLY